METRVIRQVKVEDTGSRDRDAACVLALVAEAEARGCLPHLDSHKPGAFGGTGQTFDWSIAREAAERHDLILAGGLDPDNVGAAIGAVRPWGVDVSSGVETGGVKDVDKIAAFAAQVRASR